MTQLSQPRSNQVKPRETNTQRNAAGPQLPIEISISVEKLPASDFLQVSITHNREVPAILASTTVTFRKIDSAR